MTDTVTASPKTVEYVKGRGAAVNELADALARFDDAESAENPSIDELLKSGFLLREALSMIMLFVSGEQEMLEKHTEGASSDDDGN